MAGAAVWFAAARPKTLAAGIAPVAVGTALAAATAGHWHADRSAACLAGALCLQIACNFANDYGDAQRGADGPDRLGPTRAVAAGLVAPGMMLAAALLMLALAGLVGWWLTLQAGWPVLAIGAAAILASLAYTLGPRPLAYISLGDPFVLIFFGFAATVGSAWVQQPGAPPPAAWWWAGGAVGLQAVALLAINNLRDIPTDRTAGKRTLCVRLGDLGSRRYHVLLHACATGCWWETGLWPVALATGLGGGVLSIAVWRAEGRALNRCLALAGALQLASAALAAGWIACR
jgi:1,4-dihydroxy-2-naphthoate octaprenyltransferase